MFKIELVSDKPVCLEAESVEHLLLLLAWLRSDRPSVEVARLYAMSEDALSPALAAVVKAARAMFSGEADVGQLEEAVRAYEELA